MKITFVQDHQSEYSGNEFYRAGTGADVRDDHARQLLALGVVREGWGPVPAVEVAPRAWPEVLTPRQVAALEDAGYTPETVGTASDADLLAISGIGAATVEKLREVAS